MKMHVLAAVCLCVALAAAARGELLVSWTGQYVTASVNLQGYSGGKIPFSDADQRNPAHTGSYYPLDPGNGLNTNFYGGTVVDPATHNLSTYRVVNGTSGGPDYIGCDAGASGMGEGTNTTSVWLWKKEDFQFTGYNVVVTSLVLYCQQNYGANNEVRTRMVVQQGGSYFISQPSADGASVFSSSALDLLTWYNYDPAGSISAIGAEASPGFIVGGISNVTAVGAWQQARRDTPTSSGNGTRLNGIEAQGYVVPEPGIVLGLLLAGLALLRRSR